MTATVYRLFMRCPLVQFLERHKAVDAFARIGKIRMWGVDGMDRRVCSVGVG